jgi:hypothetical protein
MRCPVRLRLIAALGAALLDVGCAGVKSPSPPPPAAPIATPAPEINNPSPASTATAARPVAPDMKSTAKTAAAATPSAKPGAAAGPATPKAPLDLKALETRLKETKAIGVLTKLSLKNQVDDLLNQFRAFYQGTLKTTVAELRPPFDRLVLKLLSLLQDSDPSLAAAIVASREAIWAILSDKTKFAALDRS